MYKKIIFISIFILISSLFAEIKGPLEKAYKNKYEKLDHYKAMYVAIDFDDGSWVYGFASNHINEAEAEKAAKNFCENAKEKNGVNGYCKLYATGNRVLGL